MLTKKRPGRPPKGPHIGLRLPQSVIDSVDAWSKRHAAGSRSEAIRQLINAGLKRGKPKPQKMALATG
jgi:metal-responsive CopG/Arc/MetJ family transcriptional regulator